MLYYYNDNPYKKYGSEQKKLMFHICNYIIITVQVFVSTP